MPIDGFAVQKTILQNHIPGDGANLRAQNLPVGIPAQIPPDRELEIISIYP